MATKNYLKIEAKAEVKSTDVIEQSDMLAKLKPAVDALRAALPEGAEIVTRFASERGPLKEPRRPRVAA